MYTDKLQQEKITSDFIPVSQEQESEVIMGTDSSKLDRPGVFFYLIFNCSV